MIASADGGSAVAGLSGGLGNRDDHLVFGGLREHADAVIVGMSTAIAEHYHPPTSGDLADLRRVEQARCLRPTLRCSSRIG